MKGRKPKPTAIKILEGTRADRINLDEPAFGTGPLDPPDWLGGHALRKWTELAPMLAKVGLFTEADGSALESLCDDYRLWRTEGDGKAKARYNRMLTEFGLTPSSRSRSKSTVEKPKDALEEFLAG